jgi:arylsulfatase A-like enzyme
MMDALQKSGQLDNTYVVFTSDNGFHLGQHRMVSGKQSAYDEDIRVPLMVRGPGIAAGSTTDLMTGNIDIAPTLTAMAHTTMTDDPDGRSLIPLLGGGKPDEWRRSYLIEHYVDQSTGPEEANDTTNGPQLEPPDADQGGGSTTTATAGAHKTDFATATTEAQRPAKAGDTFIHAYQAVRTAGYLYVEYVTGERELYDLTKDPNELDNIVKTADPPFVYQLKTHLDDLRACVADTCRQAENKPAT